MHPNEKHYKTTTNIIGAGLIIFLVLINVLFNMSSIFSLLLEDLVGNDISYTVSSVFHIIVYLACFMIPAFIIRAMLKGRAPLQTMKLGFKLPARYICLIPSTIAVCYACSNINAYILLLLSGGGGATSGVQTIPYAPYQMVLEFISIALVPAVCEEFLFRGVIAANLLPYGKGVAIIGSAVLFGLMHQNAAQIFYTTVAGIFMGYVYVKTGSILCSTIIHFINNGISVLQDICYANLPSQDAQICASIITAAVYVTGAIGLIVFFAIQKNRKKKMYDNGSYGWLLETDDRFATSPISPRNKLKYFMSPCMIIYICLAFVSVASMVLLLMTVGAVGML